jgi:hypothetical protein
MATRRLPIRVVSRSADAGKAGAVEKQASVRLVSVGRAPVKACSKV